MTSEWNPIRCSTRPPYLPAFCEGPRLLHARAVCWCDAISSSRSADSKKCFRVCMKTKPSSPSCVFRRRCSYRPCVQLATGSIQTPTVLLPRIQGSMPPRARHSCDGLQTTYPNRMSTTARCRRHYAGKSGPAAIRNWIAFTSAPG